MLRDEGTSQLVLDKGGLQELVSVASRLQERGGAGLTAGVGTLLSGIWVDLALERETRQAMAADAAVIEAVIATATADDTMSFTVAAATGGTFADGAGAADKLITAARAAELIAIQAGGGRSTGR